MKRTDPEIRAYIEEIHYGRFRSEIARMVNEKFGTDYKPATISRLLRSWGLSTRRKPGPEPGFPTLTFSAEVMQYIEENHVGTGPADMARKLNAEFGTNYTRHQIKNYYQRKKLSSGLSGQFVKGGTPWNKGMKGMCMPGAERTQFQKGNIPPNHKPVGHERINMDGYTEVKVREKEPGEYGNKNFVLKHRLIWEQLHGSIPKGYCVTFKDGNRQNFDPDNLALVSMAQQAVLNHSRLRTDNPDLFETSVLMADLAIAVQNRKKGRKTENEKSD